MAEGELFYYFDFRDEWWPGNSAPLVFQEVTPNGNCGILFFVGHVRGHKYEQNRAKVGEKMRGLPGRGWRLGNF